MSTPRKVGITTLAVFGIMLEINDVDVGQALQLQIGSGDAYTNVSVTRAAFSVASVGEKRIGVM